MIYQFVLASLGPHGRRMLSFIVDHQLIIMSIVFTLLIIERINKGPETDNY